MKQEAGIKRQEYIPRLIALETTRRCNLNCIHCRTNAGKETYGDELSLSEINAIFKNISAFGKPIIILTGGDPLLRKDIFEIIRSGDAHGLKMVIASCGEGIDLETAEKLKESGIERVSFSVDGVDPASHDSFRNSKGSFDSVTGATSILKKTGLPFQINSTITKINIGQIEELHDLSVKLGAVSFHPFFIVPAGRAKGADELLLSGKEYNKGLELVYKLSKNSTITIKPTCAPQYHAMADIAGRGCLAGHGFAFISNKGIVQTCGFLDINCGDLRTNHYNFRDVWNNSDVLNKLRIRTNYKGSCKICGHHDKCGGCRARAYAISGNYLNEDSCCNMTNLM